jgi:hypothetical protein
VGDADAPRRPPARYVVTPEAAFASVPGGGVVLQLGANRYFQLNETATVIWELLDRGLDVDAIAATLTARFEIGPEDAARAVADLVVRLSDAGLLTPAPGSAP